MDRAALTPLGRIQLETSGVMFLNLLLVVIVAAVLFWVYRRWVAPNIGSGSGFKCRTCRHCRKLYDDGVMCGYHDKQVFKNPAQIDMCPDHTPR